jgi:hypothetical protein
MAFYWVFLAAIMVSQQFLVNLNTIVLTVNELVNPLFLLFQIIKNGYIALYLCVLTSV